MGRRKGSTNKPKVEPLKWKNCLIRKLDKADNDLLEQLCQETGETTAAKALMKAGERLIALKTQFDEQGVRLAALQDAVKEVIDADDQEAHSRLALNEHEADTVAKHKFLTDFFQGEHARDVQDRSFHQYRY